VSNLQAIGIFSLFPEQLRNCAGQPHPAHVRNTVGGHFVAFTPSAKENPAEAGAFFSTTAQSISHSRSQCVHGLGYVRDTSPIYRHTFAAVEQQIIVADRRYVLDRNVRLAIGNELRRPE
jgi:hypothetical protein